MLAINPLVRLLVNHPFTLSLNKEIVRDFTDVLNWRRPSLTPCLTAAWYGSLILPHRSLVLFFPETQASEGWGQPR